MMGYTMILFLKRIYWTAQAFGQCFSWKIKMAWRDIREKADIVFTIFCVYFNHWCFGDPLPKGTLEWLWDDLFSRY